jgi:hypothetical protein
MRLLLALVLSCAALLGGEGERNALMELAPEVASLAKKIPLKRPITIKMFNPNNVYGWYQDEKTNERQIVIVDHGKDQNIRTLRHEWEHARQNDAGEPYSEPKAEAAEKDDP